MIDWNIIIPAVIAGIPTTLLALAAFIQAWKTHKSVNSRMTELLALTKVAAADEATLAEKAAQRTRQTVKESVDAKAVVAKAKARKER